MHGTNPAGIIRYAVDNGINYIYPGYSYEAGRREKTLKLLRSALTGGYRKKVKIAVTVPVRLIKSAADFDRLLQEQLDWLGENTADLCVLGCLDRYSWPAINEMGIISRLDKALDEGLVRHQGFYFHDYFQTLRTIIGEYDRWSFCCIRYSYMDVDHHPGYGGVKYAAEKGLGVIATGPHLGGRLTARMPESVEEVWEDSENTGISRTEWPLKWVWNHSETASAVSNMSSLEEVKENIRFADNGEGKNLTISQQIFISTVRDAYRKLKPVPCTACRACMPCDQGIDVPWIFELYNDAVMFDDVETARVLYGKEDHHIENCNECGDCVRRCGKQIPIPDRLKEIAKTLAA